MGKHSLILRNDLLMRFSQFISDSMGAYFPKEGLSDFEKKLPAIAHAFGFSDSVECIEWLMQSPLNEEQISKLAETLTVGETYFFRDAGCMKALKEKIIPGIINARSGKDQHIRIWSAACCTGEEPYSLAILLHQLIPDLENWRISILGTDINTQFLQKARKGCYKEWSFRATPKEIKEKYFKKNPEGLYSLLPEIRQMVKFAYLNLVEDVYPALVNETNGMDIVLCNNVLIYFSQNNIEKVIRQLSSSLVNEGWLLVSSIEVPYVNDPRLAPVKFFEATIFGKSLIYSEDFPKEPLKGNTFKKGKITTSQEIGTIKVELPAFLNLEKPILEFDFSQNKENSEAKQSKRKSEDFSLKATKQKTTDISSYSELTDLFQKGMYEEVAARIEDKLFPLKKSPESMKENLKDIILLTQTYANQGKLLLALEWCERALNADKLDAILYFLKASILNELDRTAEAKEACKHALYLDPNFTIAEFTLGNILLREGNAEESKKHLRNTLKQLKNYADKDQLPAAEGITASSLAEIVKSMQDRK